MIGSRAPALVFAAVLAAAGRRPIPWEKNHLRIGQALYRENCVVCHDIDRRQSKKLGPSFSQLFQRPQMPIARTKPSLIRRRSAERRNHDGFAIARRHLHAHAIVVAALIVAQ